MTRLDPLSNLSNLSTRGQEWFRARPNKIGSIKHFAQFAQQIATFHSRPSIFSPISNLSRFDFDAKLSRSSLKVDFFLFNEGRRSKERDRFLLENSSEEKSNSERSLVEIPRNLPILCTLGGQRSKIEHVTAARHCSPVDNGIGRFVGDNGARGPHA